MRIAIVDASLIPNEQVSQDALLQQRVLQASGFTCFLYCDSASAAQGGRSCAALFENNPHAFDLMIVHLDWAAGQLLACLSACHTPVLLRFHGLADGSLFRPWNSVYADTCDLASDALSDWMEASRVSGWHWLVDTPYMSRQLIAAGLHAEQIETLAPLHHCSALLTLRPDPIWSQRLTSQEHYCLVPGPLVPGEGLQFLLQAFRVYYQDLDPTAKLLLGAAVPRGLDEWATQVQHWIKEFGLEDRILHLHSADLASRKSAYAGSRIVLLAPEHNYYRGSILEAQALGVPVLLRSDTTMNAIAAAGALRMKADCDPYAYAAAMHELIQNSDLRTELFTAGLSNYANRFSPEILEREFLGRVHACLKR
ncbi:MAG: glycosyltransferase [Leptospiraceae bacterium]|nr:glycosyltransferase [Leptospiraceae bacterium]